MKIVTLARWSIFFHIYSSALRCNSKSFSNVKSNSKSETSTLIWESSLNAWKLFEILNVTMGSWPAMVQGSETRKLVRLGSSLQGQTLSFCSPTFFHWLMQSQDKFFWIVNRLLNVNPHQLFFNQARNHVQTQDSSRVDVLWLSNSSDSDCLDLGNVRPGQETNLPMKHLTISALLSSSGRHGWIQAFCKFLLLISHPWTWGFSCSPAFI